MKVLQSCFIEVDGNPEYVVEGYVNFTVDKEYGADADGNRAVIRTIVEDIEDVICYDEDGNEFELTEEDLDRAYEILTDKFMEGDM